MQEPIMFFPYSKSDLLILIKQSVSEALTESKKIEKEKELIDAKEVIDWLGISLSTLNKWKAENKIPYKRLGKRIFFVKSEVLKALEESNYSRLKQLGAWVQVLFTLIIALKIDYNQRKWINVS